MVRVIYQHDYLEVLVVLVLVLGLPFARPLVEIIYLSFSYLYEVDILNFADEETETQRCELICLRPQLAEPRLEGKPDVEIHVFHTACCLDFSYFLSSSEQEGTFSPVHYTSVYFLNNYFYLVFDHRRQFLSPSVLS